ncbi:hypothetical protein BDY24DRAFT_418488 [Mrakia frigida]|uniref:uncharacterized protein n=1 Tax=Mrakia frigida TaxID=29902 RepID=UPI003FCC21FF
MSLNDLHQSLEKIALTTTAPSVNHRIQVPNQILRPAFLQATEAERAAGWGVKTEDWVVYLLVRPRLGDELPAARDPWASQWRDAAVRFANGIKITQSDATKLFSVSKSDLLALNYIKSAIDALALRARGGPAHLEKNENPANGKQLKLEPTTPKESSYGLKQGGAGSSRDQKSWEGEDDVHYGYGDYGYDPYDERNS